jgi:transposase-like protein
MINRYTLFVTLAVLVSFVEILQVKYSNNLIEQDHRFIKKITNPMMVFKALTRQRQPLMESKTLISFERDRYPRKTCPLIISLWLLPDHCVRR